MTQHASKTEEFLIGKEWTEENILEAQKILETEFTPLSDANSPSQGAVKHGVTAVLRSEAKLPHHKAINGTLLNVKLNKDFLLKEERLQNLASLIKAYFKLGGFHVQFNGVGLYRGFDGLFAGLTAHHPG